MNILPRISPRNDYDKKAEIKNQLLRRAAEIGGQLFGPVPKGHKRQFFCLDRHTWVWHEEWIDQTGKRQIVTTHYSIRPDGILKQQNGHGYQPASRQEAYNLYKAAHLYSQRVSADRQRLLQTA